MLFQKLLKKSNNFPGWTKETSYLREIALFWRSIWISLNSPRSGIVADIMHRTRCKYHYAIRKIKNMNLKLRKEAMVNAISQNNSRQLWDEIKKEEISIQLIRIALMQQLKLIILFHCLQISIMLYIILYVMNIMKCLLCVMILDMILISIV